jgi:PTS system nitrogen regulatory IIA component
MQLSVKGHQLAIGDALRVHIEDSLNHILSKYFGDAIDARVTLSRDGHNYRAAVSAHVARNIHLEAHGEADQPYPAYDAAADRLSKRLRRHKRWLRSHHREDPGDQEALPAQQYILSGEADEDGEWHDVPQPGPRRPQHGLSPRRREHRLDRPPRKPQHITSGIQGSNMEIVDLISPQGVVAKLRVTSKKQALQDLARRAADITGQPERAIFEVLIERERLGTTGVGNGIAIPHGKLAGLERLYGLFARLENAIDFDAIDEQPVDLICLLLAPESAGADHLKALARVSRLLRDRSVCEKLRGSDNADAIYALLSESATSHAA